MKFISQSRQVLLVLPFFYLICCCLFLSRVGHFYESNFDITYPYLFNGTNMASGHFRVGNIIHPGTPVEIFASIVIFIKHLFAYNTVLYQDVLLHPESYLYVCSVLISLLLLHVIYFSGVYVYRNTGSIWQSILFQITPLFFPEFIWRTVTLGAESGLGICGIFFAAYLYVNIQNPNKKNKGMDIVVIAICTALLFTTKIYCLLVVIPVLFMLKGNKQRLLYLFFSGLFSLILLFPLYNQFRNWLGSIKAMVFNSGAYGQGEEPLNFALYWNNSVSIFKDHYILSSIFIAAIFVFLWSVIYNLKHKKSLHDYINPITGITIFFVLFIVIISKQYLVNCANPLTNTVVTITKYYYFIPLITFFPLFIMVLYKSSISMLKDTFILRRNPFVIAAIFGIFFVISIPYATKACYEVKNENIALRKTRSFVERWNGVPLILVSDGGDQIYGQPALFLGSYFSGKWDMQQYLDYLKKQYPDTYIYSIGWKNAVTCWNEDVTISDILNKDGKAIIYISGTDSLSEQITLKRICRDGKETIPVTCRKIYTSDNKYEDIYLVQYDKTN